MTGTRARVLAVVFCVLAVLLALLIYMKRGNAGSELDEETVLTPLTADRITEIRWTHADGSVVHFVRVSGEWRYGADSAGSGADDTESGTDSAGTGADDAESGTDSAGTGADSAGNGAESGSVQNAASELPDQEQVSTLAASLTGIGVTERIENVTDLSLYGLDEPSSVIVLTAADGTTAEISLGDQNAMTQDVYCLLNGSRKVVYAVKPSILAMEDLRNEDYESSSGEEGDDN